MASPVSDIEQVIAPGEYWVSDSRETLVFCCPGCGRRAAINIRPTREGYSGPSWDMTIDGDGITLHPSINAVGCCGWHGWLRQGMFSHI